MANQLYPAFLKLENKKVLVVGGGFVAFQKLSSLIETKAKLFVVAPNIIDEIYDLDGVFPNKRFISFVQRDYEWGDEKDSFIVIAASNLPELNMSILNRCKDQNILVCSVDNPEDSDFFIPSIASSGSIKVAISTDGEAPGLAQDLRKTIQKELLEHYSELVPIVSSFRERVREKYSDSEKRTKLVRQYTQRVIKNKGKKLSAK